jgi:hypothetical protein
MQNKRLYVTLGVVILFVGTAAFLAGRMFHREANPVSLDSPLREGQFSISSNDITPAPELPTTDPEVIGLFIDSKDNTIIVRAPSFDPGMGGIVEDSSVDVHSAPKVEVIITGETIIYRETTEISEPLSIENETINQTVEESTLDGLNPPTIITVWGRRSGDRIIAEILLYSNSLNIQKP